MARFNRYATCQSKMQRIIVMSVKALGLTIALLVASAVAWPPSASAQAPDDPQNTIVLTTKDGPVKIRLRPDLAPKHVERIKALTKRGFYDGIVFHRVIDGFMAQTGDPTGTGMGGSKYPNLKQEFNAEPHVRGVCSMARSQNPDSANSQFFIVFDDARFLDRQYTVWGKVIEGMDNVDKIKRGEPVKDPDSMVSVKVAADA
jgi:cyclophilin family peptidyl-prolyl cis-trans isomerase